MTQQDERMWTQAYKLAQSGECSGWRDIEVELRVKGFSRARQLLDDWQVREQLDAICVEAREAGTDA